MFPLQDEFVSGRRFSNGHRCQIQYRGPLLARNAYLSEEVSGLTVLHVGFADHLELIQEKRQSGTWLHDVLRESAKVCIGYDVNTDAVRRAADLGVAEVYSSLEQVPRLHFDLLLLPDVIEHLPNVQATLEGLSRDVSFSEILVTTPNAFRLRNRLYMSEEVVNSDHRYWFSPVTLARTLVSSGYRNVQVGFTEGSRRRQRLARVRPLLADGLIARATPPMLGSFS